MNHGSRCPHTAAMGPNPQKQCTQQSTNIICEGSTLLKLEQKIFITRNMTVIAHHVDNDMQPWQCNDGTTGTLQPAGQIRRCQWWVDACMCVGLEGRQGGGAGRARLRCVFVNACRAIGVMELFFGNTMWVVQCIITRTKSMVHIWF